MAIIKVKTGGITADAITSTEIADNAVVTAAINADAVTDAKIADDVVGTEHLTANEVDTTALGADAVTAAQIADDAISEEHLDVTAITGHTAETSIADGDTLLIHDASASALRKMTKANFVSGIGGTNTPAFFAFANANQVISTATYTKVEIDTEVVDTDSKFDVSNYRFTPGTVGYYIIGGHARFDSNSTSNDTRIRISKNGSVYYQLVKRMENVFSLSINQVVYLDADDYVELDVYHSRGSNMSINGNSTFDSVCATFYGYKLIGVS